MLLTRQAASDEVMGKSEAMGGVFFYTIRPMLTEKQLRLTFAVYGRSISQSRHKSKKEALRQQKQWAIPKLGTRRQLTKRLAFGEAELRGKVMGRGQVLINEPTAMMLLNIDNTEMPVAEGVPPTPTSPDKVVVYMSAYQYRQIAEVYEAYPEDMLIIEGGLAYDPGTEMWGIFAMHVTTKLTLQFRKEAEQAKALADEERRMLELREAWWQEWNEQHLASQSMASVEEKEALEQHDPASAEGTV